MQEREIPDEENDDFSDAEILDEMTTHRGELKHRSVSFTERQHQVNGLPNRPTFAVSFLLHCENIDNNPIFMSGLSARGFWNVMAADTLM